MEKREVSGKHKKCMNGFAMMKGRGYCSFGFGFIVGRRFDCTGAKRSINHLLSECSNRYSAGS